MLRRAAWLVLLLAGCNGDEIPTIDGPAPTVVGELGVAVQVDTFQGTPTIQVENSKSAVPFASQRFLIDTGAPDSVLDLTNHPVEPGFVRVELRAFGVTFPDLEVVGQEIFDYPANDPNRLDGILGGTLLRHFGLTVDYRGQRGILSRGRGFPAVEALPGASDGPAVVLPFELLGGDLARGGVQPATRIVIPVVVEGVPTYAMVDTGATWMVVSESFLSALPAQPSRPVLEGLTIALAGTSAPGKLIRLGEMKIGANAELTYSGAAGVITVGRDLPASVAAETGKPITLLIGGHMLREFLFSVDYPARQTSWTHYTSLPHVDALEFVGFGMGLARFSDGTWAVRVVYPNHDPAAMGVMMNDVLVSIDGRALQGLPVADVLAILRGSPVGTVMRVLTRRGAVEREVMLRIENLLPPWP